MIPSDAAVLKLINVIISPCSDMSNAIGRMQRRSPQRAIALLPKCMPANNATTPIVPNDSPNSCGDSPNPPLCGASI